MKAFFVFMAVGRPHPRFDAIEGGSVAFGPSNDARAIGWFGILSGANLDALVIRGAAKVARVGFEVGVDPVAKARAVETVLIRKIGD